MLREDVRQALGLSQKDPPPKGGGETQLGNHLHRSACVRVCMCVCLSVYVCLCPCVYVSVSVSLFVCVCALLLAVFLAFLRFSRPLISPSLPKSTALQRSSCCVGLVYECGTGRNGRARQWRSKTSAVLCCWSVAVLLLDILV